MSILKLRGDDKGNAASMAAIKQYLKTHGMEAGEVAGDFTITMRDFEEAMKEALRKPDETSRPRLEIP